MFTLSVGKMNIVYWVVVVCLTPLTNCLQFIDRCTLMDHCDYQIMRESMDCANYISKGHSVYYTIRHGHVKTFTKDNDGAVESANVTGEFATTTPQIEHLYCRVRFITCDDCRLNLSLKLVSNKSNGTTKMNTPQNCSNGYKVYVKDSMDEKTFQANSTIEEILIQSQSNWLQITSFHDQNILAICTLTLLIKSSEKNLSIGLKDTDYAPASTKNPATPILFNRPIARIEEHRFLNNLMLVACLSGIGFIMLISGLILIRIFTQSNTPNNINRQVQNNIVALPPSPVHNHSSDLSEWSTGDEWPSQQQQQVVDLPPSYDELRKQESPPPTYIVAAEKLKRLSAQVFRLSLDRLPTATSSYQVNKNKEKRKRTTRSLKISNKESTSTPSNLTSLHTHHDKMDKNVSERKKMRRSIDYLHQCVSIESRSSEDDLRCGCKGACSCNSQRRCPVNRRRRTSSLSPTSLAVASRIINSQHLSPLSSPDSVNDNYPPYYETKICYESSIESD